MFERKRIDEDPREALVKSRARYSVRRGLMLNRVWDSSGKSRCSSSEPPPP